MSDRYALALFAKYPEPGKVKTRLAKKIGVSRACELYRLFLHDLCHEHRERTYDLVVMYHPLTSGNLFRSFFQEYSGLRFLAQQGKDLGERLNHCFKILLSRYQKVIIIGCDIPHLDHTVIHRAFALLGNTDVVIGPAEDGGYYLIGLKCAYDIFRGIEWGTESVLSAQVRNIDQLQLRVRYLEKRYDVDTWTDMLRLKKDLRYRENAKK